MEKGFISIFIVILYKDDEVILHETLCLINQMIEND